MKGLRYINTKEKTEYMKSMQSLNRRKTVDSEDWFWNKIDKTGWNRQCIWGYRIFDFWNSYLGCAIEIDGTNHDSDYDKYRDEYNFRRSGIVVLRIRNYNEDDFNSAMSVIGKINTHSERRIELGITKSKSPLSKLPYDKNNLMLDTYISKIKNNT